MALLRAAPLRSISRFSNAPFLNPGMRFRQVAQRRAFVSVNGTAQASKTAAQSDLPWFVGAVAVTVPTVWYLWPSPKDDAHVQVKHEARTGAPMTETVNAEQATTEEEPITVIEDVNVDASKTDEAIRKESENSVGDVQESKESLSEQTNNQKEDNEPEKGDFVKEQDNDSDGKHTNPAKSDTTAEGQFQSHYQSRQQADLSSIGIDEPTDTDKSLGTSNKTDTTEEPDTSISEGTTTKK